MKKQWRFWLGFVVIILVVLFSVLNTDEVQVNFGFVQMNQPLVIVIVGSVFIGALIMFLLFFSSYWKRGKQIKNLKKELKNHAEIDYLEPTEETSVEEERLEISVEEEPTVVEDESTTDDSPIKSRSDLKK